VDDVSLVPAVSLGAGEAEVSLGTEVPEASEAEEAEEVAEVSEAEDVAEVADMADVSDPEGVLVGRVFSLIAVAVAVSLGSWALAPRANSSAKATVEESMVYVYEKVSYEVEEGEV
jgi:hypothetical protein